MLKIGLNKFSVILPALVLLAPSAIGVPVKCMDIPPTTSPDKYKSDIKKSLEDFVGHCIVGLYIKDCFSKIKNQKINGYLKNFLYILSIYS